MQMYFHHVGQRGSSEDFPKTVFADVPLERIESHLRPDDSLRGFLRRRFPNGSCNVWGVPSGAHSVIQGLNTGDAVLLVQSTAGEGSVPALCPNVIYHNHANHDLSQELWGNARFPYVFFFATEPIEMTWSEMCRDLGYMLGWQPRYFVRITPERLEPFGGPEGYLRRVRELHGYAVTPFSPPTDTELAQLDEHSDLEAETVASELRSLEVKVDEIPQLTEGLEPQALVSQQQPRRAAFRLAVLRLYSFQCALCGSSLRSPSGTPEVQAAHIYPKRLDGSDDPRNGVCLCTRHHWAFDVGWMSIADDYTVLVREDLPTDDSYTFIRGSAGQAMHLPSNPALKPHPLFLAEHRRLHHFSSESRDAPTKVSC